MTNDFLFSSIDFINEKGLMTNYELLLKTQIHTQIILQILKKIPIIVYLELSKLILVSLKEALKIIRIF